MTLTSPSHTPKISLENDPRLKDKEWRLSHLYKIVDRDSKIITFKPNKAQTHYHKNKHKRNIILKSRRLGFTTYSAIDMLDNTLFNKNFNSIFLSYDDASAKEVFESVIMHAWNHFKLQFLYSIDTSNANMLKLDFGDKTNSLIEVKTSKRGGRTNHIHVSELGKIASKYPNKAREIFSGTIPSLVRDGFLTIESTAEGDTGEFHDLYMEAKKMLAKDPNYKFQNHEYKPFFYNWQWDEVEIGKTVQSADPFIPDMFKDYQRKHNEKAQKMPHLYRPITDIEITFWYYKYIELGSRWTLLLQEFPTTEEEAFQSSGQKLFDILNLEKQKEFFATGTKVDSWVFYKDPKPNHKYVMGVDPSEGIGSDHSAIVILDITQTIPEVVATYTNKYIAPDMLAYEIKNRGIAYNHALAIVERNNSGHATLTQLKQIYPEDLIYREEKKEKIEDQQTERLGWHTNLSTKPRMFFDLSTAINEGSLHLVSEVLYLEARGYKREALNKTKADPNVTNHFDMLTALAIAYQGRIYDDFVESTTTVTTHSFNTPSSSNQIEDLPAYLRPQNETVQTKILTPKNNYFDFLN